MVSPPGLSFKQISGGAGSVCALTADGTAYCVGDDADGQLGNGGGGSQTTPIAVAGNHRFARISVGTNHVAGIELGSGAAWAWGKLGSKCGWTATCGHCVRGAACGAHFGRRTPCLPTTTRLLADALACCPWHAGSNEYGKCGTGTAPPEGAFRFSQPVLMDGNGNWSDIVAAPTATLGILRAEGAGLPASPLPASPSPIPADASPAPSSGAGGQPEGQGDASTQETSSSSFPVGAVVGAVVGALGKWRAVGRGMHAAHGSNRVERHLPVAISPAAIGALAFLALRPGRGWLRRAAPAAGGKVLPDEEKQQGGKSLLAGYSDTGGSGPPSKYITSPSGTSQPALLTSHASR